MVNQMTGIVVVKFADKENKEKVDINFLALAGRCEICVTIDKNKKITDFLEYDEEKEKIIIEKLEKCISNMNDNETYWRKEHDLLLVLKDNKRNFLEYVDEVEFNNFTNDVVEYIKKNKVLQNKKIKILNSSQFNEKNILKLKKMTNDIKNIEFSFSTIPGYINLESAENYLNLKNKIVEEVKKYDYSPLEKIMYIYDKVKEYECPEIFQTIINEVGIKSQEFILTHMDKGIYQTHNRSLINLEDSKYEINGAYFFDPILELKENNNRNQNVNSYKFFAKNIEMMEYYDLYKKYIDTLCLPAISEMKEEKVHENYLANGPAFAKMPAEISKTINGLFRLLDKKPLKFPVNGDVQFYEKTDKDIPQIKYFYENIAGKKRTIKNKILKYVNMFYKTIDSKTLMAALSYVREIEEKENPDRYKHNYEELIKASINSDWGVDMSTKISHHTKEELEALSNWIDDNDSEIEELPIDDLTSLIEYEENISVELEEIFNENIDDNENNIVDNIQEEYDKIEDEFEYDKIEDEFEYDNDSSEDINVYIKNCLNDILSEIDDDEEKEEENKNNKK